MDEAIVYELADALWSTRGEIGEGTEFYRGLIDRLAIFQPTVTVEQLCQALRLFEERERGEHLDLSAEPSRWLH